ncbi:MAG: ATP-binding protein [Bacteroidales bacterium]|nr:ATP-binding protein [Bacteroidales bacterium]
MIKRNIEDLLRNRKDDNKVILLFGARQTGKTTLLKKLYQGKDNVLWLNGDNNDTHELLGDMSASRYKILFAPYNTIIIDEAQYIKDIGRIIKIFTDELPEIKIFATGSSAFDLSNKTSEPLTGRKWEFYLFPLSFSEMCNHHGFLEEYRLLEYRLLYGYYPEVVNSAGNEKQILKSITDSYLYKDLLTWSNIKHSDMLIKLLQMLALQVGSEVSYNNLSKSLGIDRGTVERYIDLLEKSYVVFKLSSFSRNYRNELKKSKKIYFADNGIRNALIANFSPLSLRNDVGALWENFLISERRKKLSYDNIWANTYFWRTTSQIEIDYVEEQDGKLNAFEFKWNADKGKNISIPSSFSESYPEHTFQVVTPKNIETFLL